MKNIIINMNIKAKKINKIKYDKSQQNNIDSITFKIS